MKQWPLEERGFLFAHPDMVFFEWIMRLKRPDGFCDPAEVDATILAVLKSQLSSTAVMDALSWARHPLAQVRHRWTRLLAEAGAELPRTGEIMRASKQIRDLMFSFSARLRSIPAALRPILWRYAWEGLESRLECCVPRDFDPHVLALSTSSDNFSWPRGGGRWVLMFADADHASRAAIESAMQCASSRDRSKPGPSAVASDRLRAIVMEIALPALMEGWVAATFLPTGEPAEPDPRYARNWSRTAEAFREYVESGTVTGALLYAIQEHYRRLSGGENVSDRAVRRTLEELREGLASRALFELYKVIRIEELIAPDMSDEDLRNRIKAALHKVLNQDLTVDDDDRIA